MAEISIIVPVYNAEKYLERCLNSILAQKFINFEVLLINDGSSDESLYICNMFALKDNRITVFDKKNEGVSATRQYGIEKATEHIPYLSMLMIGLNLICSQKCIIQ